ASHCCEDELGIRGECNLHTRECGDTIGVYFVVKRCSLLYCMQTWSLQKLPPKKPKNMRGDLLEFKEKSVMAIGRCDGDKFCVRGRDAMIAARAADYAVGDGRSSVVASDVMPVHLAGYMDVAISVKARQKFRHPC
ncbi:hypothetical protein CY34DRAFT_111386, partial [Suillus luteus UH-Slu-Lm8-n1]